MNKAVRVAVLALIACVGFNAHAAKYNIDIPGMHAAIQFKVKHGGISWLVGRFDDFTGSFEYDSANPGVASAQVTIKTASISSNHAERDVHLRSEDYLDVKKYPEATFKSTRYVTGEGGMTGQMHGQFTLRGVTKDIVIDVNKTGEGELFGSQRVGFEGTVTLNAADYNLPEYLGDIHLNLYVEGIKE